MKGGRGEIKTLNAKLDSINNGNGTIAPEEVKKGREGGGPVAEGWGKHTEDGEGTLQDGGVGGGEGGAVGGGGGRRGVPGGPRMIGRVGWFGSIGWLLIRRRR